MRNSIVLLIVLAICTLALMGCKAKKTYQLDKLPQKSLEIKIPCDQKVIGFSMGYIEDEIILIQPMELGEKAKGSTAIVIKRGGKTVYTLAESRCNDK